MKKKNMLLSLSLLFTGMLAVTSTALSPSYLDSLPNNLTNLPDGSEKAAGYTALAKAWHFQKTDSAIWAASNACRISEKTKDWQGAARAALLLCKLYTSIFQAKKAHTAVDRAEAWGRHINAPLLNIEMVESRGDCFANEGRYAEALEYYKKAISMGEGLEAWDAQRPNSYARVGYYMARIGQFEEGLGYVQRCLDIFRQRHDQKGISKAYNFLANVYAEMGDYEMALNMEQEALTITSADGVEDNDLTSLGNICDYYFHLGDFEKALEGSLHLQKMNALFQKAHAGGTLYKRLGEIYFAMGDVEQARINFQKAATVYEYMNDPSEMADLWQRMTPFLIGQKEFQKAAEKLTSLAKELEARGDSLNAVRCHLKLGDVYQAQGRVEAAKKRFLSVAGYVKSKSLLREEAAVSAKLAAIYLIERDSDTALRLARQSLSVYQLTRSKKDIADAHLLLHDILKQKGDFQNALYHHEQYSLYLDSIKTQDLRRRLAEERVKQNIADMEADKTRTEREKQLLASRNRLYLALSAALLALLFAGAFLFWKLRKAKNLLDHQHLQLAQLNRTKDKFFGIIAHDLRNPLSAFRGVGEQLHFYLKKGDMAKLEKVSCLIAKSAASLGDLLDNLLSWALLNRGMIPYSPKPLLLAGEVFTTFGVQENMAAAKNIQLACSIPSGLKVQADQDALQAILRNLLCNAIKFTSAGGQVAIGCKVEKGQALIAVTDTGTGMSVEKLDKLFALEKRSEHGTAGEKGAGLGLLICKELVEMNKGVLSVSSAECKGSTFEFSLPIAS